MFSLNWCCPKVQTDRFCNLLLFKISVQKLEFDYYSQIPLPNKCHANNIMIKYEMLNLTETDYISTKLEAFYMT